MKDGATTLNRRTMLQAMAATTAVFAAPQVVRAQNNSEVLIIGAGLSGLAAGLLLQEAGAKVRIIEGRDRVGGRVLSYRTLPGNPEVGGTSFGPGYARLVDAARTYGVGIRELTPVIQYYAKRELFLDGQHISMQDWPSHPRNPFPEQARAVPPWAYLGGVLAKANPLKSSDAWVQPENATLDIPYRDWLVQQGVSDDIINVTYNIEPSHGNSAYDVSTLMMLFVASFIAAQQQLAVPGQSPFLTAEGGNQAIPEGMAAAFKGDIEFGRNVTAMRSDGSQTEVHCADGTKYKADHVICSIPCSVLRRIKIDPVLPPEQARAVQTLNSQIINQAHMIAKEPFWEEDGLSPNMFSDGLVCSLVGEHKGDDPAEVTSVTAWIRGHSAALLDQMPDEQAKAAVIADIERHRPAAKGKLEIVEYKSWYRDPFSSGDWAVWQPGQVSTLAPHVGKPHGRLHFCGEHTAVSNRGMEGAMESGERVAFEVLEML
ncbi:MAG: NAD(P)/FAD-dependent oxidoreductase [Gammaproteobacteria bacterium]|nr:NAD(P)/FAD-dependent oxidoreductase [Gammaproteobacteria bacterium]